MIFMRQEFEEVMAGRRKPHYEAEAPEIDEYDDE